MFSKDNLLLNCKIILNARATPPDVDFECGRYRKSNSDTCTSFSVPKNSKLFYFDRGRGSVPCIQQMSVSLMRTSTQSVTETGPAHFCLTTPVFVKGLKGPPCELYEPGGGDSHI